MQFPGGLQKFMQQAAQMQNKLGKLQKELADREIEGTSGGGAVKVLATGTQQIKAVTISKDVVESKDADMLQDLVLAAVNDALKKSKDMSEAEMQKITGGASFPGMF